MTHIISAKDGLFWIKRARIVDLPVAAGTVVGCILPGWVRGPFMLPAAVGLGGTRKSVGLDFGLPEVFGDPYEVTRADCVTCNRLS